MTKKEAARGGHRESAELIATAVEDVLRTNDRRAAVAAAAVAARGRTRERGALVALIIALPILALSFLVNVKGQNVRSLMTPAPSPAIARQHIESALQSMVSEIESFKRDYSELPSTLAEVGVPQDGEWTYVNLGSTYVVEVRHHGQTATFDSSRSSDDVSQH